MTLEELNKRYDELKNAKDCLHLPDAVVNELTERWNELIRKE